ncbi:MAG: DUF3810 domain-containing protein [Clostridia bacterium]
MKNHKVPLRYLIVLLLPLGIALNYISLHNSYITERWYSNNIYKLFSQVLSILTGLFPFSLAELMLVTLIGSMLGYLIVLCIRVVKKISSRREVVRKAVINMLVLAGVLYFSFIILWGLNYNRMTAAQIFSLDTKPASVDELVEVCKDLILRANHLRSKVDQDADGVMYLKKGRRDILSRASKGYDVSAQIYKELGGRYGPPKGIMLSNIMAYSGIWGVFSPFTAEANVNMSIPSSLLASTACHEMAHQRGFAREDEANYIAYLSCSMHPDYDFQYSGVLLALINAMNALYQQDYDAYKNLRSEYNEGLERDMQDIINYNKRYQGYVEKKFSKANDLYLKANNQKQGELSYGRMVDLLIAEYRKNIKKVSMNNGF